MRAIILILGVTLAVLGALAEDVVHFHGQQVLRAYPKTKEQVQALDNLQCSFDFWTHPRINGPTDIRAPSAVAKKGIVEFFHKNGIDFEVMIPDLEALVAQERASVLRSEEGTHAFDWTSYHSTESINQFLDDMAKQYAHLAEVIEIGTSTQGRPLRLIRIGANGGARKAAYFIDGGIHAREWIAPAVATYWINELLTKNDEYGKLLEQVDFYILPVANVDGYEFTRSNNRMWRKTRSNHNSIWGCLGVDPNRNFDVHFGGPGTSADKCSDIYKGPAAFSEPETKAMRDFVEARSKTTADWKVYNALHSYSQLILTPWGWTNDLPEDYAKLRALGDSAAAALRAVSGTRYTVGSVTELLTPGSGGSDDWAYGSGFFEYSYTIELRDTGSYGFLLPPAQIIPTSVETIEAIKVMASILVK